MNDGSDTDAAAVEHEIGETQATTTGASGLQSPLSSELEDVPMLTQVSEPGDSQATEVGDDDDADSQAQLSSEKESESIARVELAFKSDRSLEDGGRSGQPALERAPSRMNGVPDDAG